MTAVSVSWQTLQTLQQRVAALPVTDQMACKQRLDHVWSSNAIEGNHLTRSEVAMVLKTGQPIAGKALQDGLAVLDLNAAYDYLLVLVKERATLTATVIRDLNRLVTLETAPTQSQAGAYRTIEVWPAGLADFPYEAPLRIPAAITGLIEWQAKAVQSMSPVEYAAELHQRFVTIHPFADGNGRTARLLMNLALLQAGYPLVNLRPDEPARSQYLDALQTARKGDRQPFKNLIALVVYHQLLDIEKMN